MRVRAVPPAEVDVRAIREKLKLSQPEFAARFGFTAASVRQWEQGRRRPHGPARVLLTIIAKEPNAVRRALEAVEECGAIFRDPANGSCQFLLRSRRIRISATEFYSTNF